MRHLPRERIPIIVLTGFLGAGKTTILKAMLRRAEFNHSALIINEIGQIALDHDIVETSGAAAAVLAGGCICCQLTADVGHTLRDLFIRSENGSLPRFERVIVETTGLAHPGPIVATLVADGWIGDRFELRGIVTLADAANLIQTLELHDTAAMQIALADRIVLTKVDLLGAPSDIGPLQRKIRSLNAAAPMAVSQQGSVEPGFLLAPPPQRSTENLDTWLECGTRDAPDHSRIDSASIRLPRPMHWSMAASALDRLFVTHGRQLLRVKGLLNVQECDRPVLVQGVQATFHPPALLERWPEGPRESRVVFITHGIDAASVAEEFSTAVRRI